MNNKFDELAKAMAQSVNRRQALKKFGIGLAGMAGLLRAGEQGKRFPPVLKQFQPSERFKLRATL
jgi:hypothetical protein